MSLPINVATNTGAIELLTKLGGLQQSYETAKKELNDVQKKLHGTPFMTRSHSVQSSSSPVSSAPIKRGRGRPRKTVCVVETVDNASGGNVIDNNIADEFSSCETGTVAAYDECDDDTGEFKGAVFTFISDGLYVETREGKFYDIYTLELRGWFNPYTQRSEWL